jgi:hypothetical protein
MVLSENAIQKEVKLGRKVIKKRIVLRKVKKSLPPKPKPKRR